MLSKSLVRGTSNVLLTMNYDSFPIKIGTGFSGTVSGIGSAVDRFRIGDEVFGYLADKNPKEMMRSIALFIFPPFYLSTNHYKS